MYMFPLNVSPKTNSNLDGREIFVRLAPAKAPASISRQFSGMTSSPSILAPWKAAVPTFLSPEGRVIWKGIPAPSKQLEPISSRSSLKTNELYWFPKPEIFFTPAGSVKAIRFLNDTPRPLISFIPCGISTSPTKLPLLPKPLIPGHCFNCDGIWNVP